MPIYDRIAVETATNFINEKNLSIPDDVCICSIVLDNNTLEGYYFEIIIHEQGKPEKYYYIERPLGTHVGDTLYFEIPLYGDTVETIYYVDYAQ